MYLPPNFGTVTSYCFIDNADQFVEFLKLAFDGSFIGCSNRPDGKIANAQVRIGNITLMISEASNQYKAMPSSFYIYVENADLALEKAIRHGATLEMAVENMPYDDRQGGVRDAFGNLWWISQRLVKKPYF